MVEAFSRGNDLEQLTLILASIRDAVIIADPSGAIISANPASEILTGFAPHELAGERIAARLLFSSVKGDVSPFLADALAGDRAVSLPPDSTLTTKFGVATPVAATSTPFYGSSGEQSGTIFVLRDLTEDVRLKKRQYEFLSFVAHQLREPMGGLRWGLEVLMLDKDRFSEGRREILDNLYSVVLRFLNLINSLVSIARLERGEVRLERAPVDLAQAVAKSITDLTWLATSQNITISFTGQVGDPLMISGDAARLADVWNNLIANAIRYNHPRGTVSISVSEARKEDILARTKGTRFAPGAAAYFEKQRGGPREDGRWALVMIADTGLGIPVREQATVFEGFSRGKNVVARGLQGSGLGLFIVKSVVEASDGFVFFTSVEDQGTTFFVILPCMSQNV